MKEIVTSNSVTQELADKFISYLDISEISVKSYVSGIRKFLMYLSDNKITAPTRDTIVEFKKTLSERYAPKTVSCYLSSVKRFFAWLDSEGLYKDIARGVKAPKLSHEHKRDAFSADELGKIISGLERTSLEDKRNYAIFTLISATGLRTIEAVRADVGDIRKISGVTVLYIQGKGHSEKDAFVKLEQPVLDAIEEYLQARGAVKGNEPLFASCSKRNRGGRLTTRTISGVCKNAMIHAGYNSPRLTAHSLRHSAVTIALMQGMSLQDTQAFARHANIATTTIYAHNISRLTSLVENSIAQAIFGQRRRF